MKQLTEAYSWSWVMTWFGAFGSPTPNAKRLHSNCRGFIGALTRRADHPNVPRSTRTATRQTDTVYLEEFCDAVFAELPMVENRSHRPVPWIDIGADDGWADAELSRVVADMSV